MISWNSEKDKASRPPDGAGKLEQYAVLHVQLRALIAGETDWLANCANSTALLFAMLPDLNWAGFYLYKEEMLVLGPFQGNPACIRIPMGKGVCGTAAVEGRALVVEDVHEFPGHIACDSASCSEIVIPFFQEGNLIGVLDLDSPIRGRFDEVDRDGLEVFLEILTDQARFSQ